VSALEPLADHAGRWRGTSRLHDPETGGPEDSASELAIVPVLGGRFLRVDYTWSHAGEGQEGSILLGYEADQEAVSAHWIDTYHVGDWVMACRGTADGRGGVSVRGSYAEPPGPDWHWRIELSPMSERRLRMVMTNISPDGREEPAVEAIYERSATT
jgi:hypothetical protein